jgi:hypothetical protein
MKTGRRRVTRGYVAKLQNINATEAHQKVEPFPLGSRSLKKLLVSGFEFLFPVFQNNPAGIPIAAAASIKRTIVHEKPA